MKKINPRGMSNPLALATASQIASSKEGQKAIGQTMNAAKVLVITLGLYFTGKYAWTKFKEIRARNFANENIGHPDLIAATIIMNSFKRIGPTNGILSYILPQINYSTDEATLYDLASKVSNIKGVANAYRILFDRNLSQDLQDGLDNEEVQKFYGILNSPQFNNDVQTMFGIGLNLYSAVKGKEIRVNKAIQKEDGSWVGTNESYGNFKTGEEIGSVIYNGIWTHEDGKKENYYIVKQGYFQASTDGTLFEPRRTGVVLQHQVTDVKK